MGAALSPSMVARAFQGICPYCDKGPYKSLATHVNLAHGLGKRRFKDELGVTYETPLCSAEYSAMQREKSSNPEKVASLLAMSAKAAKGKRKTSIAAKKQKADRIRTWTATHRIQDPEHGTGVRYKRDGCRCDKCKAWNAERGRSDKRVRTGREVSPRKAAEHGSRQMYEAHKCRCGSCRSANAESRRRYRARRKARKAQP